MPDDPLGDDDAATHDAVLRVVVLEDSGIFREMLVEALVSVGIEVVGASAGLHGLRELVAETLPDVVILDIDMADGTPGGLLAARELRELNPRLGLLFLTNRDETYYAEEALKHGPSGVGYQLKNTMAGKAALRTALERVAAGDAPVDPQITARLAGLASPAEGDPIAALTRSQRGVLNLIAEGYNNRAIGRRLFITESTVEKHVAATFRKLALPTQHAATFDRRVRAVWLYLRSHHVRPQPESDFGAEPSRPR
jgi:DNA-binding NarL/FixJ family response regulator